MNRFKARLSRTTSMDPQPGAERYDTEYYKAPGILGAAKPFPLRPRGERSG